VIGLTRLAAAGGAVQTVGDIAPERHCLKPT
jgi:hypothetical protein